MKGTIGRALFGLLLAGALSFGATQALANATPLGTSPRACPASCHQFCHQTFCPHDLKCTGECDTSTGECVCYYP